MAHMGSSPLGHINLVSSVMSVSKYSEDCPLGTQRLHIPMLIHNDVAKQLSILPLE